jgi:hypothetical protein
MPDRKHDGRGLSDQEIQHQQATDLPDREAMSLLDIAADLNLDLNLAAPIDAAVAANANVAAPIDAAVSANAVGRLRDDGQRASDVCRSAEPDRRSVSARGPGCNGRPDRRA